VQRRTILTGIAGTLGSIGFIATQVDSAEAQTEIQFGELEIPSQETYTNDQTVESIDLTVDAHYAYSSPTEPSEMTITLSVGTGENSLYPIAQYEDTSALPTDSDGTETLSGAITETPAYSIQQFNMDSDGAESSSTLIAELSLTVTVSGEEHTTTVQETAEITVIEGTPTIDTQLGGEGEISVDFE
jgi:hypothetical protein